MVLGTDGVMQSQLGPTITNREGAGDDLVPRTVPRACADTSRCGPADTGSRGSARMGGVLRLKRAYEPATPPDGHRVLVDRLWPRGLSKERASIDEWMKDVAPSAELREWFAHDPERWPEFQRRYKKELRARQELVRDLAMLAAGGRVTLVYGARDEAHNDAVVLADVVRARMRRSYRCRDGAAERP